MNSNNNILCSGAAEAASIELSPPLNETSGLMESQRQVCGPAIVRNTQQKVASGENNESTFQCGQISVQVEHVSADRIRQSDVAVKEVLSSGLTGKIQQEEKAKFSHLGMPHKLPGRRPVEVQPLAGNSYAPSQQVVAPSHAVPDGGEFLEQQRTALNPDVAPFVPRGYVAIRDGVGPSAMTGVESCSNSSPVQLENKSNAGMDELDYSEAPRIAPISTQGKSIHVSGFIEGKTVKFLLDTGAEVTAIGRGVLSTLPKTLRTAFQDRSSTLKMANGESVIAYGPVLCNISLLGKTVLEAVYVMSDTNEAILGMPALTALSLCITLAGVEVVKSVPNPTVRRLQTPRVYRVTADRDYTLPPRSEAIITGKMQGKPIGSLFAIEPKNSLQQDSLLIARTVAGQDQGRTPIQILNPSDSIVEIKVGEHLADAEATQVVEAENVEEPPAANLPEHLKPLFDETCARENLSEAAQCGLRALLLKHKNLFAKDDNDLGRTDLVVHDINTGDARPIRQPPRRVPSALQPELEANLSSMLEKGVAEPGQSPWASPVVLVRKKDGSIRFCVDYRRLNAVTQFDAYPLPRIDETFEALSGSRYFTTLDLLSGYWQVGLTESARIKSAFTVRGGLYLWNVMPFGLCNAPSTFERLMESVLQGLQWKTCLVYLDDVVIFASTEAEMLKRMDEVFTALSTARLKLKPRKCILFARQTDYLGHVISERGVSVSPSKISAIREWPIPENATDVRSFLGTASYYRRFVRDFASIAAPLHRLTEKGAPFVWTPEQQKAFESLKTALSTTPVLRFPVSDAPYVLDTDASLTGIGAVLSQVIDGEEYVLGYASRTLDKAQRNYCVTRRELLAVVHFVRHFRPYLYGRRFTVRTDHSSLQWLLNFKEPEGQLARWMETLSEYKFDIQHRPGKKHGNADGLSRQGPCRQCGFVDDNNCDNDNKLSFKRKINLVQLQPKWTTVELGEAQRADPDLALVIKALENQSRPSQEEISAWSPVARRYLSEWDRLHFVDGALRRRWYDNQGRESHDQYVVPRKLVTDILKAAHDSPLSGHFGARRTLLRARGQFFWARMSTDVRDWYRSCQTCCARRPKPSAPHHPAHRQVVAAPLQRVALDILGPLDPPTARGNSYIMVVVDYCTKWVEAMPMVDQTAQTCARHFVEDFVCRLGIPEQLHSDQGRQFESALFQEMCRFLRINKTRTTALHPQSDGQTERANRTLLDLLAKLVKENESSWDEQLPYALAAYRSSVHRVTGETPNRLMLGREVGTPLSLHACSPPGVEASVPWVDDFHRRFSETHRLVVGATQASHRADRSYTDRRQKGYRFEVGGPGLALRAKSAKGGNS